MTGAETIVNDDRVIVKYVGVLDTKVAPEFGELLNEAVDENKDLEFDFSGLDYILSAGIRAIIAVCKKLKPNGKRIYITGTSKDVQDVLSMTGVDLIAYIT